MGGLKACETRLSIASVGGVLTADITQQILAGGARQQYMLYLNEQNRKTDEANRKQKTEIRL